MRIGFVGKACPETVEGACAQAPPATIDPIASAAKLPQNRFIACSSLNGYLGENRSLLSISNRNGGAYHTSHWFSSCSRTNSAITCVLGVLGSSALDSRHHDLVTRNRHL
jgi:hypothetical protein